MTNGDRIQDSEQQWTQRWSKLWKARVSYRRKVWLGRILQRGIFTGDRWAGGNTEERNCRACGTEIEDLEHVFWNCRRQTRRIIELEISGLLPQYTTSLMDWVDQALSSANTDASRLFGLGVYLATVWRERNKRKFQGTLDYFPTRGLLQQVLLEVEAFPRQDSSKREMTATTSAKLTVCGWIRTWQLHQQRRNGHTTPEDDRPDFDSLQVADEDGPTARGPQPDELQNET
ncbi:hypothetical protein R1sor_017579 [Riccia sorocarpa]|uniref:Reverse transcriptase zinc-binding domain-containing protein n=1 Tax=Riccia sorocarpa TaxID=122646 RepID=A0ABD3I7B3_9MARC